MKIYKSVIIQKQLSASELKCLVSDFRRYKKLNQIPDSFGRDALYDHPNTLPSVLQEEIAHIHLVDPKNWHVRTVQFNKTSDTHLVYCPGYIERDTYLLMAILAPDAHSQARKRSIMWKLAEIAQGFRERH